jgi:protein-tyrosine phosphatase
MPARYRICFVCLGNICRSPTAEGVMRALLADAGLDRDVTVDSAGTGRWHLGEPPDPRTCAAAARRGIVLDHAARQVTAADFDRFDLLVAMDAENRHALQQLAPTPEAASRITLLRAYDPASAPGAEVPDPWYGGARGFEVVLDVCDAACRGLLAHVRTVLAAGGLPRGNDA